MVRYFEDVTVGETHDLGAYTADREELLEFARRYDPQPIHVDPDAAERTMFGGLIASGWHTGGSCMALLAEGFLNDTSSVGRSDWRHSGGRPRSVPATSSPLTSGFRRYTPPRAAIMRAASTSNPRSEAGPRRKCRSGIRRTPSSPGRQRRVAR